MVAISAERLIFVKKSAIGKDDLLYEPYGWGARIGMIADTVLQPKKQGGDLAPFFEGLTSAHKLNRCLTDPKAHKGDRLT
jgi:hypothetical protein